MSVNPIPEGYHTITPFLVINGARKFITFLQNAFGATEVYSSESPDGKINHSEIKVGDSMLMLTEADEKFPSAPGMFYIYVKDTDLIYKKALAAGAESLMEPEDKFYGDRNAGVKDSFGNTWWIGTHIENVTSEEIKKREENFRK